MKKILLLLLIPFISNTFAQKHEAVQAIPEPVGLGCKPYHKIDTNNDGYAAFEITEYYNYIRLYALRDFGHNLSGYTLQMYPSFNDRENNTNPITTDTFVNPTINIHAVYLKLTYNGNGPIYGQTTMQNYYNCHELITIPANGDADQDGVLNSAEDLNNNGILFDDDTDGLGWPNYGDSDDDNDGILTINEDYNNSGSPLDDDMNSNNIPDYLDNLARGSLPLNLKLFIEGYYAGSGMMQSVKFNQDGVSPTTDVENITIELHKNTTPFALVASSTAMLKTNGNVACSFPTASVGSYYIVVKSSNGIETWSTAPQSISTTPLTYNFSTAANKAYGNNMKLLGSGVYGLYSGDLNQDENIDGSDAVDLTNDVSTSEYGIKATDLNGDGSVDASDVPMFENNSILSIYTMRP